MVMKRELIHRLNTWKSSSYRKPMLVMGARQVGKTTLVRDFGKKSYRNLVELNFDDHPQLKQLFERDLDPKRIVRDISLELNVKIIPGETLLFFDEIQDCPNALNSLKYFRENANEYHVCGAGSLLGVKLMHTKGFPVGQVHFEKLFPLSFFEFLDALNQTQLKEYLLSLTLNDKINPAIHEKCLDYLKYYLLIGGMPEAIYRYQETKDFNLVRDVHKNILHSYDLDFMKHAPSDLVMKITECFHSISSQLSKENKKFIYSIIREGARARNYEMALQWLVEANLFNKVYQVSTPKMPLRAYENSQYFKAYFCDVGLLTTLSDLPIKVVIHGNQLFQEFHGALTENFVAQELVRAHERLHYW
ncbi:MAG: ATPase, partial [uncultured bacterium]